MFREAVNRGSEKSFTGNNPRMTMPKCQLSFEQTMWPNSHYQSGVGGIGIIRCTTHNMPINNHAAGETQCPLGKIDDRLERVEMLLAQVIPDKSDDV